MTTVRVDEAVRARLLSLTALAALVGQAIRVDELDQGENADAVCIVVTEEFAESDLQGQSYLVNASLDVECYSRSRTKSRQIAEAVRSNNTDPGTGLAGFDGNSGKGAFTVLAWRGRSLGVEVSPSGEGTGRFVCTDSYEIQYTRAGH